MPEGSIFQGYEAILVQDLKIEVETIRFRREAWLGPNGGQIVDRIGIGVQDDAGEDIGEIGLGIDAA